MNIKPLGNRVVVELKKQATTSASGIIIATESKTEQQKGKIIAIGAGFGEEKAILENISVGQTILFGKYGGDEIKTGDEVTHKILDAKDILAIVE